MLCMAGACTTIICSLGRPGLLLPAVSTCLYLYSGVSILSTPLIKKGTAITRRVLQKALTIQTLFDGASGKLFFFIDKEGEI